MSAVLVTLAVYSGPSGKIDSVTMHSIQQELQQVLLPAGIQVEWPAQSAKAEPVNRLVIVSFDGDCSVTELPAAKRIRVATPALGDTDISQAGRILPFFHVDCDAVTETLWPALQPLGVPARTAILGRALARVMAHEIYHVLSESKQHADSGVAKPQFSKADLLATHFEFDRVSLIRMRGRTTEADLTTDAN